MKSAQLLLWRADTARMSAIFNKTSLMQHIRFFDADGDGKITFKELREQAQKLGMSKAEASSFAVATALFRGEAAHGFTIDVAQIEKQIFKGDSNTFDEAGHLPEGATAAFFAETDTNADGVLDRAEIVARVGRDVERSFPHASQVRKAYERFKAQGGWDLLFKMVERAFQTDKLSPAIVDSLYSGDLFFAMAQATEAKKPR